MKSFGLNHHFFQYDHPARETPAWSVYVERWYQLDAFAYGLAEAYWQLREKLRPNSKLIILSSPGASNATDFLFAQTVRAGAPSPSRFVHTLPNIRASSLCQVLGRGNGGWEGQVLCLQNDPSTFLDGVREAVRLPQGSPGETAWCLSVSCRNNRYQVDWIELGPCSSETELHGHSPWEFEISRDLKVSPDLAVVRSDVYLIDWFSSNTRDSALRLGDGLELRRSSRGNGIE